MTDDLESVLRQLIKNLMREVVAELMLEWKAPVHHQAPQATATTDGLLLTSRETAKRLAISERSLFQLTRSGQLPCVRIGKCVRYNIETIQQWIREVESTEQPSTSGTKDSQRSSKSSKPEPTGSRLKPKLTAGQKQRIPIQDKTSESEHSSPQIPLPITKGTTQQVRPEERISPFSVLLKELDIDRSSLPPLTNGDLMRIVEVDIVTMHGWLHLSKPLPEEAINRLKNHFRSLIK